MFYGAYLIGFKRLVHDRVVRGTINGTFNILPDNALTLSFYENLT